MLREVLERAGDDANIKVLMLPPDAHRTINALQRSATERAKLRALGWYRLCEGNEARREGRREVIAP